MAWQTVDSLAIPYSTINLMAVTVKQTVYSPKAIFSPFFPDIRYLDQWLISGLLFESHKVITAVSDTILLKNSLLNGIYPFSVTLVDLNIIQFWVFSYNMLFYLLELELSQKFSPGVSAFYSWQSYWTINLHSDSLPLTPEQPLDCIWTFGKYRCWQTGHVTINRCIMRDRNCHPG